VNRAGVAMEGWSLEVSASRDDPLAGGGDGVEGCRHTVGGEVFALGPGLDDLGGSAVVALANDQRVAARGEHCNGVGLKGDC
jgi:hypothetical protein